MKRLFKRTWKRALVIAGVIQVVRSPLDAYDAYQQYRDVLVSLLDDARRVAKPVAAGVVTFIATAAPSPVDPPSAPLCAGANQINATFSFEQSHVFENMNVSDCNTMVRVVMNTPLTPGTGQLQLSLHAQALPSIAHATGSIANATKTNSTIQ